MPPIIRSVILSLLTTWFFIWLLKPTAIRLGFVDHPGGRKQHPHPIPLIGGLVIFGGFCFGLLSLHISLEPYRGMIAGAILLVIVGAVDDLYDVHFRIKLFGQVLAALFLIFWGNLILENPGNLFFLGPINFGHWGQLITVFLVMLYINAINFLDGIDGLAAGVSFCQILFLLFFAFQLGSADSNILLVLLVPVFIFLLFNFPFPGRKAAQMFLGDSGSMLLGFLIIYFTLHLSQLNVKQVSPVLLLWILAFPVFDLAAVSLHRILKGKSPFAADRKHVHHLLHALSLKGGLITVILIFFSVLLGFVGILLNHHHVSNSWMFWSLIIVFFVYFVFTEWLRYLTRNKSFSS